MMKNINKKIKNINNFEMSSFAFLAIGFTGMFMNGAGAYVIPLILTSLPLGWFGLVNKVALHEGNNKEVLKKLFGGVYKNTIDKSIEKYLDDSQDLLEKKYKLLFISLWMEKYSFKISDFKTSSLKIDNIIEEIKENNISKEDLNILFYSYNTLDPLKLIKEDIKVINNVNLIKISDDFSKEGFLGDAIAEMRLNKIEALSFFNKELTEEDIKKINKKIETNKKMVFYFQKESVQNSKEVMFNLITSQSNGKVLEVLKEYFESFKLLEYDLKEKSFILDVIEKTKFKVELTKKVNQLEKVSSNNTKRNTLKKTKI